MSLDQLPNELIAHIGSFLNFEDNIQFGLSQKRINAVLKRDGLLKPECKELMFYSNVQPRGYFTLPDSTRISFEEETRDPKYNSVAGQIIDKVLHYGSSWGKLTEEVFKDLMKTKTKLSSLSIISAEVIVDPNIFIAACKKFNKIELHSTLLSTELLCDEVIIELMPYTMFYLCTREFGYHSFVGYSLTDKTLKALYYPKVKDNFGIHHILTSFTIAGIKNLVEGLLNAIENIHVIYHPRHQRYSLGILKFSEKRNAVRWMEEVAADPGCPYRIDNDPFGDLIDTAYSILLKDDDGGRYFGVYFSINQVEA